LRAEADPLPSTTDIPRLNSGLESKIKVPCARRQHLNGKHLITLEIALPKIRPACDEYVRLHDCVVGVDHVQWRDEDPQLWRAQALELHSEIHDRSQMLL
jgi:hypothetical protein